MRARPIPGAGQKSCKIFAPLAVLALALPAAAQHVGPCDPELTSATNVDWSDPTRTFANGAVRLTGLDVGAEDARFHVMVTFPEAEGDTPGCRLVSADAELTGFGSLSLRRTTARYDTRRGVTLGVPGTGPEGDPLLIEFLVQPAQGTVALP
jgi:hypothetical protein